MSDSLKSLQNAAAGDAAEASRDSLKQAGSTSTRRHSSSSTSSRS